MDQNEVNKLTRYIEENLRSSISSGITFVDARNFRSRIQSKQNHVVFGRRGAGKTSLVQSVRDSGAYLDIYINLEDYKDITFPNIVIYVLFELFDILNQKISSLYPFYKPSLTAYRVCRRIKSIRGHLKQYLHEPDTETQNINTIESYHSKFSADVAVEPVAARVGSGRSRTREIKRTLPKAKLDFLRIELTTYKKLILEVSSLFSDKPIYLILDDFYFVSKGIQPELIDYFHRLTKGTALFIKVATIKHRSKLYRRMQENITGVELGHDILEVDMDYTLNDFDNLQLFMRQLLDEAIAGSRSQVGIDDVFSGDGFSQLCLASGGVPRDFLSLFVMLGNTILINSQKIGKVDVTDAAIRNSATKMESMRKDSDDEVQILEGYLLKIKRFVFTTKRTNCFLVAKDELEANNQLKQAIRELVDLRLLHLIDDNTSRAPSDGRRYEAYVLDLGLYDTSRPRNFEQIDPTQRDEKSRKDTLRASPILSMPQIEGQKIDELYRRIPTPGEQLGLGLSFE